MLGVEELLGVLGRGQRGLAALFGGVSLILGGLAPFVGAIALRGDFLDGIKDVGREVRVAGPYAPVLKVVPVLLPELDDGFESLGRGFVEVGTKRGVREERVEGLALRDDKLAKGRERHVDRVHLEVIEVRLTRQLDEDVVRIRSCRSAPWSR